MDNFDRDLEDLLNMTDSDNTSTESSNTGVFGSLDHVVLELHDLKKDEPAAETVPEAQQAKKKKEKRKKKKQTPDKDAGSVTSSSLSDSAPTAPDEANKEEFYDAHESYHALPENQQASPTAALVLAQVHSEHAQEPKTVPETTPAPERTSATPRHPSTINVPKRDFLENLAVMEKPSRYKAKNKKPASKSKTPKKRKSDGPTCSMFLAELTRKLAMKKKQEAESPKNVVQMIIDSITNALPVKVSKKSPSKKDSPMKIETLQSYAPELLPNDVIEIPRPVIISSDIHLPDVDEPPPKYGFKMPKMPLINSDVFKLPEKRNKTAMEDAAVNTNQDHDVASEITKHVGTLKKISLIAEEFNQKTAKNLKEIVDSVQEDLIKKLEEIKAEEKAKSEKPQTIAEDPTPA